ncbi:MAG: DNA-3-methyladenine glycosylase I [Acidimicrobiales bacterium]|jgi:DNA-3-methyladenine glycosylase I
MNDSLVIGEDGHARCGWGSSTPDYAEYHDLEWGRAVTDDRTLFEKMCLEGFQSGLSWITVLRKRPAFREVFADFDAGIVAGYGEPDVLQLLDDTRIIRHRGKIEATISNARVLLDLQAQGQTLAALIWSYRPDDCTRPRSFAEVPATTPGSTTLSKDLKKRGFRFVGPTTAYAAMQAMGVVNDHIVGCWVGDECDNSQKRAAQTLSN